MTFGQKQLHEPVYHFPRQMHLSLSLGNMESLLNHSAARIARSRIVITSLGMRHPGGGTFQIPPSDLKL